MASIKSKPSEHLEAPDKQFQVHIKPEIIEDLKKRLAETRWPDQVENADWEYGTDLSYLKTLCNYWGNEFNWSKQEDNLNELPHFKIKINDTNIHYIHQKGNGKNNIPLLLTHGFPDSFIRFLKIIPLLTETDKNGLSFDVIIPSVPGFGFSGIPSEQGMNPEKIAILFSSLMINELGYDKYYAHGGDWGSSITEQLAFLYPQQIAGIHLTDIPFHHLFSVPPGELTEPEKNYLETGKKWQLAEGGYAIIQSTPPNSSYGLNDSPAGLAGWIIEKFKRWSDCNGDIENCFSKDELLNNLTIYWATTTINSAMRIYYETNKHPLRNRGIKLNVPTGVALFPKDIINAPREFAERFFNIVQWTKHTKGGHFAAMELPELLADDIRKFVTACL